MKWQPIETAPKGAECLIFAKCNKCENCHLSKGRVYVCEEFDADHIDLKNLPATHWMPLPEPPK